MVQALTRAHRYSLPRRLFGDKLGWRLRPMNGDYWRNLNEQPMRFVVEGLPGVERLLPATLKGSVQFKGKGPARVTIIVMGSTAFDATQVDATTLRFGGNEDPAQSFKVRDSNRDGMADLEVTFQTRSLSGSE